MKCEFVAIDERNGQTLHRCRRMQCGLEVWSPYADSQNIHAACRGRWLGLGDFVAWLLGRLGFEQTKTCRCRAIQRWLNDHFPFPWRSR